MQIQQFYDTFLAHASYAIISNGQAVLIDPSRNPQPYYDLATQHNAKIIAVIETHPHADFISSHLEVAKTTGAKIYASKLVKPDYSFVPFDDGDVLKVGELNLHAMNTPGHSPDSISIVLKDASGKDYAVFTGDTLFIGDVGRPDLRENVGSVQQKREELAKAMYYSLREKLMKLPDDTIVYPAHGAGSLCGKNLSKDTQSSIGREKMGNYALQPMSENEFVKVLLEDQPFIPKYFGYAVDLNKKGAPSLKESLAAIPVLTELPAAVINALIIDTRNQVAYRKAHVKGAINNLVGGKFETWLGSIVGPEEKFYLIVESKEIGDSLLDRAARIGYEKNILGVVLNPVSATEHSNELNLLDFEVHQGAYTVIDIRNNPEVATLKIFENSIHIPLYELRERVNEIPIDKPIMVHCAGGYRSAIGSSIIKNAFPQTKVYDLGEAITDFAKKVNV